MRVLVTGAGGFISGHLVKRLLDHGHKVRAVDIKKLDKWWQLNERAENVVADLRLRKLCMDACSNRIDHVYNLAADMGGIKFITENDRRCSLNVLINSHLLLMARLKGIKRYFFSSSACVYRADKQNRTDLPALKEQDAWPAEPEGAYGLEKLYAEEMCGYFGREHTLETRVARFHNVHGPYGSWNDDREKVPAAICRKVAEAKLTGKHEIDIWGDGTRTRSFMWIGDCIEGILKIMDSDIRTPINLGSSEVVTINELVDIVEEIAGVKLRRRYDMTKAQGVHGRNSDNTMILERLGWEPGTPLREGLEKTYKWIQTQVANKSGGFK